MLAILMQASRKSYLYKLLVEAARGRTVFYLVDVMCVLQKLLEHRFEPTYGLDEVEKTSFLHNKLNKVPAYPFLLSASEHHSTQVLSLSKLSQSSARQHDINLDLDSMVFPAPFRELFIWAILMDRSRMARFFWERGDNPVRPVPLHSHAQYIVAFVGGDCAHRH